jgi:isopentenyl-diphosphate delta-isomerase
LYANLGIAQVIHTPIDSLRRLIDALQADAFVIHCNPLQECIQPEGTPYFKGAWEVLHQLVPALPVPVIIKETGCGFSSSTLQRLDTLGVAAVDVSGLGGTHWGRIEGLRANEKSMHRRAANTFRSWGEYTVDCVRQAQAIAPSFEIWGSGGVRNGLDAAKLFALGASNVAFAQPILAAAMQSSEQIVSLMQAIEYELKVALFCSGSASLSALKEKIVCY